MIDVSEFQGAIVWAKVPKVPALIRVTYGSTGSDLRGALNLAAAKATGHTYGGYHFLEDASPEAEIDHFLSVWRPVAGGLRGMIDVEPSRYSHPTRTHVVAAYRRYKAVTGHMPILYGTHDVLAALGLPADAAECPLMLAGYGPNDGHEHPAGPPPAPWKQITAHQYTSMGTVAGITGHVDLSSVANPALLHVPAPTYELDAVQGGKVVARVAYGSGRVKAFLATKLPALIRGGVVALRRTRRP